MVKRHYVLVNDRDGQSGRYPLKAWLRENRSVLPNADPSTQTSHQLRGKLIQLGWSIESSENEVLLIAPTLGAELVRPYIDANEAATEAEADSEETYFEYENQLQDFLVQNLNQINFAGNFISLYADADGRSGREYPTKIGYIDILARNSSGDFFVIKLKRGRASDRVVGQVLRYMGWVKKNIALKRQVYGVIVALSVDDQLKYAASVAPNILTFEYRMNFSLNQVGLAI